MSSPQHNGVAGLRKGQATLRSAFPVTEVIGAGAKGVGFGGVTDIGFGQGNPAYAGVLKHSCFKMHVF